MARNKEEKDNKSVRQSDFDELLKEEASQSCKECGGSLKFDKVNLEDFEGGKLYMIDEVPALICENCGEVWIPKPFLDEFEKMVETVKEKKKGKKGPGARD